MSGKLERALRWAALHHRGQERRASGVPYVEHVMGVALILERLGFPEDVVIAGLLHDLVEDTEVTLEQIHDEFGAQVAETVHFCTEVKTDARGQKRPWLDRKRDHLNDLERAPVSALAVVLADKLHNLVSIQVDLEEGRAVWETFNAQREQVLWYYQTVIEQFGEGDPRLADLADQCQDALAEVREM
ncbi:MAG TPA: HD domain-containing protein [Isosphaeraceae bacterium]|jgi:(p)ppGpp synthase/HD superfamily hydrolase|nr:HD domain-containing protein [Isosphaeraceae bacterium]